MGLDKFREVGGAGVGVCQIHARSMNSERQILISRCLIDRVVTTVPQEMGTVGGEHHPDETQVPRASHLLDRFV